MTSDVGQSGLPAASPESIESAELDSEEKPSRRSILKNIETKMNVWFTFADADIWSTLTGTLSKSRRSQLLVLFPVCLRSLAQEWRGSLLAARRGFSGSVSLSRSSVFPKLRPLPGTEY